MYARERADVSIPGGGGAFSPSRQLPQQRSAAPATTYLDTAYSKTVKRTTRVLADASFPLMVVFTR